jgi:hypothetical protein
MTDEFCDYLRRRCGFASARRSASEDRRMADTIKKPCQMLPDQRG